MAFTEQQIKTARAKVKTGADFPREIQEFKAMGIRSYEFHVDRGGASITERINNWKPHQTMGISPMPISR